MRSLHQILRNYSCKTKGTESLKTNLKHERNWQANEPNVRAERSIQTYLSNHFRDVVKPRDITNVDKLEVKCGTGVGLDSRVPKISKTKIKMISLLHVSLSALSLSAGLLV